MKEIRKEYCFNGSCKKNSLVTSKTYNGALKSRTLAISFSTLLAPKEAPQQTIDNYKYYPYK